MFLVTNKILTLNIKLGLLILILKFCALDIFENFKIVNEFITDSLN